MLAQVATEAGFSCLEFLRATFLLGRADGIGPGRYEDWPILFRVPASRFPCRGSRWCWPRQPRQVPCAENLNRDSRLLAREATETSLSCQGPPTKRPTIWDNPLPLSQARSPQNSHYPMSGPVQPLKPTIPFSFWQTIPPVSFTHKKHIIFILRFRSKILSSYYSHIAVLFCDDCRKEAASEPDKMEGLLMEILVRRAKWVALRRGSQICCHIESLLTAY